jgi:hypothetical protein
MIPIVKEPDDMQENTGVYENCVFCEIPTPMWHEKTNNPVCVKCCKVHKVSELTNHFKQSQNER